MSPDWFERRLRRSYKLLIEMYSDKAWFNIIPTFIQFRARFDDLPTFTFFVVANSVASAYLILSLPLSIFHIAKSGTQNSRVILVIFDTVVLALVTAGASASAAIVYLAHNGNTRTNWFSICQQYNSFCDRTSGSLIGSFGAVVILVLLILLLPMALSCR
ncbi:hypothetical protein MLD38_001500 [Melastoma candidum]|uniref:Uncharacterized protein n=1 Tax=Melastoma candidum TaxID=119954 RepID=A0ACB9SM37_9MYRT|nr:hypothetical protein MLD38_001500 [Melastoma candidum]